MDRRYLLGSLVLPRVIDVDTGRPRRPTMADLRDRGIVVDDEHLAVESIRRTGAGGEFLTDPLTLEHLRDAECFENDLFDMTGLEDAPDILTRAREKVDAMTADFESPVPGELQEKLRRYFHDVRARA